MLEYYGSSLRNDLLGPGAPLNGTLRRLRRWIGIPLAFVLLVFIGQRIYTSHKIVQPVINQVRLGWFLTGVGIVSIALVFLGWNWIRILGILGARTRWVNGMSAYFLANLARYIPGGIWHFTGRLLWLIGQGYAARIAVRSLVLEQGITLVAAGVIGFAFSDITWGPMATILKILAGLVLTLLAGLAMSTTKSMRKGLLVCSRYQEWGYYVLLGLSYGAFWIIYGLATVCLAAALVGYEWITIPASVQLIGQTALSWAAGYIVFFIPGGWGVRELVFMHLLSEDFPESIAVLLPILSRLVQILAESLCGSVFLLLQRLTARRQPK